MVLSGGSQLSLKEPTTWEGEASSIYHIGEIEK